jgi:hypothetical protein
MASGKKPDPRRKKNVAPYSAYLKVECGKKFGGYSAGEFYGCYAHRTYATQPCVANITDDEMQCPYCVSGMEPEWRAWVPFWDSDWILKHVLIGEEIAPSVDAIPFRAKISISRAKNPISPLIVREEVAVFRELPATAPWLQPVNMLSVCLVLWKNAELTRWVEKHAPKPIEKEAPVLVCKGKKIVLPPAPPALVLGEYKGPANGASQDMGLGEALQRIKSIEKKNSGKGAEPK